MSLATWQHNFINNQIKDFSGWHYIVLNIMEFYHRKPLIPGFINDWRDVSVYNILKFRQ